MKKHKLMNTVIRVDWALYAQSSYWTGAGISVSAIDSFPSPRCFLSCSFVKQPVPCELLQFGPLSHCDVP